jgi:type III pantothenate kinase
MYYFFLKAKTFIRFYSVFLFSMNLVVDIGNTSTKLGIFQKNELVQRHVLQKFTPSEIQKILKDHPALKFALVSNVGIHGKEWYNFLSSRLNCKYLHIDLPLPIQLNYKTPETLGTDRIAAAAGAACIYPKQDVLIIDAGTCIKYDFIDSKAIFHGGAIAPGLLMRLKALKDYTAKLPQIEVDLNYHELTGKSTRESMLSGTQIAIVNEINGFIDAYTAQYTHLKCVISGGDSEYLAKAVKKSIFANPNLVLFGLNHILEYNAI